MDIAIHVGPERSGAVADFHYHINPPNARIIIRPSNCPSCKDDMLSEEDYINILNHEMIEIFAVNVSDARKWNAAGFDKIMKKFGLEHVAYHIHRGRDGYTIYTINYG